MRDNNAYERHPMEDIEPIEVSLEYREASIYFFALLESCIAHIITSHNIRVGMAQVRVALGLEDQSMTLVASKLGVTIQCISTGARKFVKENNLPTPRGLEGEESSIAHKRARESQLK